MYENKDFLLGKDFSFLGMKYLIDMYSEEERLTFIHLTLASTQPRALQIVTFCLPKKKKKDLEQKHLLFSILWNKPTVQ